MHNDKQFFTFSIKNISAGEIDHARPRESKRSYKTQPTFEMTPGFKPFTKCFTLVTQTRLKQIQFLASMSSAFCEAKFIEILFFCYKKAETQTYE